MQKLSLLLSILLTINALHANCPKKKGHKRNPKQLQEVVVTPQNLITAYRASKTKAFDLVHTKLSVRPVFKEKQLYGTAEITLKPHFYSTDKLELDAKWMAINTVELKTSEGYRKLTFSYDTLSLKIDLDSMFENNQQVVVRIDYVAKPYTQDSAQVEEGRGLYFIDVEDKNPYKPMHLWTQGEEEESSCWFPTLDATNQKTTQEIYVTLDTGLVSLSNGLLIDSKNNGDGTKTDYWKQDKPHAPYLFFLGIGDYYKSTDKWRDKEVSAYTFPKYKDAVAQIFRNMPEMMEFLSQKLGVDFPWDKMANIIAYDYTAGAMENSSAIIYFDKMLCNKQQLVDENFDWIIMHELFHQWFGDLVTAESWANLSLNESMADFSEILWAEYKYGTDDADAYGLSTMEKYLKFSKYRNEPIINYYYDTPHDMFDPIRYEKGGRVLNMLKNYLGDKAFFEGLKKYLTDNKFKSAEITDLRKAFEEVTGQDLNWFFNQWWMKSGHPILDITHDYDVKNKTIELGIRQKQSGTDVSIFRIPTKVDIYTGGKKKTEIIEVTDKAQIFYFPSDEAPQLVNFDADKVLLCEKKDYLYLGENIFKFNNAELYADKYEVLEDLADEQKENIAVQDIFFRALKDKSWNLRIKAISLIEPDKFSNKAALIIALKEIIENDKNSKVREQAITKYAGIQKNNSVSVLESVIKNDSSFITRAAALNNLCTYNRQLAYTYAEGYLDTESPELMAAVAKVFKDTSINHLDFFKKMIWMGGPRASYTCYKYLGDYLKLVDNIVLEQAIAFLVDIYTYEESSYNTEGAQQLVKKLQSYYSDKAKKDKLADVRLQIINKVGKKLL